MELLGNTQLDSSSVYLVRTSLLTRVYSSNDNVCADDLDILESDPEVREEDWHMRPLQQIKTGFIAPCYRNNIPAALTI